MIKYSTKKSIAIDSLKALYADAGWQAYLRDLPLLREAIRNSLDVISAWEDEKLVGLIRTVGDGQSIIYIQDILVIKSYQRKGIGTVLMQKILLKYAAVRQIVLLTNDTKETRAFYKAQGFSSCDDGKLLAFARML